MEKLTAFLSYLKNNYPEIDPQPIAIGMFPNSEHIVIYEPASDPEGKYNKLIKIREEFEEQYQK
jgi:hypothetical protein